MTDDIKIYAYSKNKFVEVDNTYFSKTSDDVTFINEDKYFKIEINTKKRKMCDEKIIEENNKLICENMDLKEKLARLVAITNMALSKPNTFNIDNIKNAISHARKS
jgi:regulator of replication initiation timing